MIITRRLDSYIAHQIIMLDTHLQDNSSCHINNMMNILVIEINELGDAVLMTPFIRELRNNAPSAKITLMTKPHTAQLFNNNPYIDNIITLKQEEYTYIKGPFFRTRRAIALKKYYGKNLTPHNFDTAILPRWDADYNQASFIAFLSGARTRIAFSEKSTLHKSSQNKGVDKLFTHVIDSRIIENEAVKPLEIIRHIGGKIFSTDLEINPSPSDIKKADKLISDLSSLHGRPLIALFTKGNASKRHWPIDKYLNLCSWLTKEMNCYIIIIGGQDADADAERIKNSIFPYAENFAGRLSITETAAVIAKCSMYIGSDSGPAHLAASQKTPIIEISCHPINGDPTHPNSPYRYHPWNCKYISLQPQTALSPCKTYCKSKHAHCISQIDITDVQKAFNEMSKSITNSEHFSS